MGIALAACQSPTPAETTTEPGLNAIADFPIGGAINIRQVYRDSQVRNIVLRDFGSVTSTNDMKPYSIAPRPDRLNFSRADSVVAFAREHGMRVFGHALVWHYALPEHIYADRDSAALADWLVGYIDTVVTRYRDDIDGWDVLNEVFDTRGGELRATPFLEIIGPDYIALALQAARRADPDAKLFINDFGTERDSAKLAAQVRLVDSLRQAGVPIDGFGLQFHLQMGDDTTHIRRALRQAAGTGLLVHISELDLIFNTHNDEPGGGETKVEAMTPELLAAQADRYEFVARAYREEVPPAQRYGITFWDFTDRDTWIKGFFEIEDWPTLFDENLEPKPAYEGFARGLR
jgi:endo-1,4-beta-xylanase